MKRREWSGVQWCGNTTPDLSGCVCETNDHPFSKSPFDLIPPSILFDPTSPHLQHSISMCAVHGRCISYTTHRLCSTLHPTTLQHMSAALMWLGCSQRGAAQHSEQRNIEPVGPASNSILCDSLRAACTSPARGTPNLPHTLRPHSDIRGLQFGRRAVRTRFTRQSSPVRSDFDPISSTSSRGYLTHPRNQPVSGESMCSSEVWEKPTATWLVDTTFTAPTTSLSSHLTSIAGRPCQRESTPPQALPSVRLPGRRHTSIRAHLKCRTAVSRTSSLRCCALLSSLATVAAGGVGAHLYLRSGQTG